MRRMTRREFVKGAVGAATVLASGPILAACSGPPSVSQQPQTIRIMMNGGAYEDTSRRVVIEPFMKANNATVEILPALSAEMLTRVRAEKAAPTVDMVVWDDVVAVTGRAEELVEKIDPANIPNLKDLDPQADYKDGYSPAVHANVSVFAYNPANVTVDPPRSFKELTDPRFKGMLMAASSNSTSGILFLLQLAMINGGGYDNIEPGFEAQKRLAPNMAKYYTQISEIIPTLKGEPVIGVTGTSQVAALEQQGTPMKVVFPEEGSPSFPAAIDIVKGTKVKALCEKLLNAYLEPNAQAQIAKEANWVVFNKTAPISPDVKAKIPPKPIVYNPYEIAKHREEWAARWKREIGGA